MARIDEKTLNEFNRLVLREFEGGDAMGGWGGTGSGGYMGLGGAVTTDDKLFNAFIKPFTNVAKTAFSGAKAVATSARTVVVTLAKAILERLIPTYKANYQKTFKAHDDAMRKIEQEHEPVYRDVMKAFKHPDFLVSAFFMDPGSFFGTTLQNPQTFLTIWGGLQAPKIFGNLLSSLSGGTVDPYLAKMKSAVTSNKLSNESFHRVLIEADKQEVLAAVEFLTDPKLLKATLNSDTAKKIRAKSTNATEVFLNKVLDIVTKTTKLTDIEQAQSVLGEKIPEFEKLKEIPEESREEVEKSMLEGLKNTVKQMYAGMLEGQVKQMIDAGVPKTNKMILAYVDTIKKIKSL